MPAHPDTDHGILARLNTAILQAHDLAEPAKLSALYRQVADVHDAAGRIPAAAFFMTQALVYALEAGSADAESMAAWLRAHGRQ